MEEIHISSCPLNCWDTCGLKVTVKDGKVMKVEGDETHPITQGKICGRGRMLEARTNSKERLLHPLKKVNGQFVRISWEQALDEIAEKMKEIKNIYGTTAVLHSHDYANNGLLKNLDQRFFHCYGGVTELAGSLCWGAGIEAQTWDFGSSYSHAPEDIYNSKQVVVWGRNVARTNMHLFQHLLAVKKRGTKVIVIDPLFHQTAQMADLYVSVKPGMDGFLAIGIMKEILRLGLEDRAFIEQHTVGFDDVVTLLESITIDEIERITEVDRSVMTELAVIYGNRPTMTYLGLGMQRYANGGNTIRLIDALVAISGNIGIPGGGANFGNLQVSQSFNIKALTLPERKTASRTFTMMKQAEGILQAKNPEIKMIIVTCGNPLTQVPNTHLVKKAFQSVETVVVFDQFMTDTAELADYVLPTTTVFEEEDIYYSSMYHAYVNYGPALVEPPGEAKSDLWIWTQLANRLGFGDDFAFTREEFLKMGLRSLERYGITLERLKKEKHMLLPVQPVPWSDYQFQTPSGKYEFTSALAEQKGMNGTLQIMYPAESAFANPTLAEKYPYQLLTIHPLRSNHSQHYHLIEPMQSVKIEVSKDIAEEKGLAEGDMARVFNDRGELIGKVKILIKAHPKTINVDEGQWQKFGGSVNVLTSDRESDNGQGSTLYDCLVNIEKISESQ
ncbi:molybdopterin-dependent oxidoreductase [Thermaerobacillus caldiproteolyticus]|uniref:Anaerobic selenocysteine-containing dehydrogenase n=1 Tax=Thermaerobacillus caldiproteolyticus TaxID=247480 RepID=A0A7W0BY97_9BACL|nr:molybdopterin-dependent oxidoreductase [Anoxybacillus caldiproteolyticus]MBA2874345.1 anaerobic selenocysteine-containing dehydrogenase [Anoxybacillus caldiproteolyticus]QPA30941.1 molybdopterin-dependent oxidoreductase [Anoxybacillus caldiproteolyticus]